MIRCAEQSSGCIERRGAARLPESGRSCRLQNSHGFPARVSHRVRARRSHNVSRPARGSEERKRGRRLAAFFVQKIREWRCSGHGNTLVGHGGLHWHADASRRFKSAAPEPGSSAEARSTAAPLISRRPGFERCSRRSSAADRCRSSNRAWPPTTDPCRQAPRSSAR